MENYSETVQELLSSSSAMEGNTSLKTHFLNFRSDSFSLKT